tara:strand:- start:1946 stop:2239 length:294 start_codon:yes stop_codon:yes gene_type:complete
MAFEDKDNPYRNFKLGDLVYYHESYVIPPDAVNWKFADPDTSDKLAIIVEEKDPHWDTKPHSRFALYTIMHIKSGIQRTCSSHNLTKAYFYDEIDRK